MLTAAQVKELPKALLHDHLDGGLRPATVVEIAAEVGHQLPDGVTTPDEFAAWVLEKANSGSLPEYLEIFAHTTAVMQRAEDLHRVAMEAVLDLAADGVVYAELRYAPEQHLTQGLSLDDVVAATTAGFADGVQQVAETGGFIHVEQILDAMRHLHNASAIADLAISWQGRGVAGFDIAGPEDGFPPLWHAPAFDLLASRKIPYTIHAGEVVAPSSLGSIGQAINRFKAPRIGHGVEIAKDLEREGRQYELGLIAESVRAAAITLELCPTSNVQTGAVASIRRHPIKLLMDLGFTVTLNTDNRLMTGTLTEEVVRVAAAHHLEQGDLYWLTMNAMATAFTSDETRHMIISQYVAPGYAA